MKPLAIWTTGVLAAFAALAGVTASTRDTEQVFVVVDNSFGMQDVWSQVPDELDRIDDRKYAEFAVATTRRSETTLLHDYQADVDFRGAEQPVAPCSLDQVDQLPAAAIADERIFITTTANETLCPTSELDGWTIIYLDR